MSNGLFYVRSDKLTTIFDKLDITIKQEYVFIYKTLGCQQA